MKYGKRTQALWMALCLFVATSGHAVELKYIWQVGDVQRFVFHQTVDIWLTGSGESNRLLTPPEDNPADRRRALADASGGPGPALTVDVTAVYTQTVKRALPDGKADIVLRVEKLALTQGGRTTDLTPLLSKRDQLSDGQADAHGKVRTAQAVTVLVDYAASRVALAKNGGMRVLASVDHATGRVQRGRVPKPDAAAATLAGWPTGLALPGIDVLPAALLGELALPDGDVAYRPQTPIRSGVLQVTAAQREDGTAELHFVAAPTAGRVPRPHKVDATERFDVATGRLLTLRGTTESVGNAGGVDAVVRSRFALERQ